MVCLPEYKAGRAETCSVDKVTEHGAGSVYSVRLPDGYLLDCGTSRAGLKRAEAVRDCVNVLMKWEGAWPPVGSIEAIIEMNMLSVERYKYQEFADGVKKADELPK